MKASLVFLLIALYGACAEEDSHEDYNSEEDSPQGGYTYASQNAGISASLSLNGDIGAKVQGFADKAAELAQSGSAKLSAKLDSASNMIGGVAATAQGWSDKGREKLAEIQARPSGIISTLMASKLRKAKQGIALVGKIEAAKARLLTGAISGAVGVAKDIAGAARGFAGNIQGFTGTGKELAETAKGSIGTGLEFTGTAINTAASKSVDTSDVVKQVSDSISAGKVSGSISAGKASFDKVSSGKVSFDKASSGKASFEKVSSDKSVVTSDVVKQVSGSISSGQASLDKASSGKARSGGGILGSLSGGFSFSANTSGGSTASSDNVVARTFGNLLG